MLCVRVVCVVRVAFVVCYVCDVWCGVLRVWFFSVCVWCVVCVCCVVLVVCGVMFACCVACVLCRMGDMRSVVYYVGCFVVCCVSCACMNAVCACSVCLLC